ncbi:hypothetical protein CAEBREN_31241 [Caenorhabditis brenneri]|uniref:Uncharacterized protein n=1 Tax=Caenorhabditis brenneri TaxID=135651 RepID=G0PJ82_CAEBE|nr:hypothetical protein CAEBREN_31241 [Caenorhabditis brenneri]
MLLTMCISILSIFQIFNSSIHCIICLTVSSHYRETVKSLFLCQKEEDPNLFKTSRVSGSGVSGTGRQRNQ